MLQDNELCCIERIKWKKIVATARLELMIFTWDWKNHILNHYTRVVHGSHFRAIFGSFSLFIFLSFFKNELQNESRMTRKMIIFAKWSTPPHFAKMVIFAFIVLSFSRSIFVVLSNSAPTPNPLQWPPSTTTPPPSHLYHHLHNSITTGCHHSHAHAHID